LELGMRVDDLARLASDRARRAEKGDPLHAHSVPAVAARPHRPFRPCPQSGLWTWPKETVLRSASRAGPGPNGQVRCQVRDMTQAAMSSTCASGILPAHARSKPCLPWPKGTGPVPGTGHGKKGHVRTPDWGQGSKGHVRGSVAFPPWPRSRLASRI